MSLVVRSRRDIEYLIQKYGNTVTIYNPTISRNDEGDVVYILGTGTSTKMLVFPLDEETLMWKYEGLDTLKSFRCYLSHEESLTKESILYYRNEYYTIYSFAPIYVSDSLCFYDVVITATDMKFAKPQTISSSAKIA